MITASHGSRAGLSHLYENRLLEDATAVMVRNGVACAVVCDGASCCRCARPIANRLSKTISHFLTKNFQECVNMPAKTLRKKIFHLIRRDQMNLQSSLRCRMEDLGCTLLAAAMDESTGRYMAIQLGDGIIIGHSNEGRLLRLTTPDQGEHRSTYLTCCGNETLMNHLQIVTGTDMRALLCSSDGLEGNLYSNNRKMPFVSSDFVQLLKRLREEPGIVHELLDKIDSSTDTKPLDDFSLAVVAA